ncbi:MAG: isoleucine--tRNA ligase [Planctomycetota bacterium]|nr:MAG: isoleucine--tRNA ligase [Planctomycetota bacterium]
MSTTQKPLFEKVGEPDFIRGEHSVLKFWQQRQCFQKLREKNRGGPRWSFLDGPITANNPMGVHHAWGRTYKDAYSRYFAMTGHELRYQNGFDCQGLWVEVEVERELNLGSKRAIEDFGIDRFVNECKKRVLRFAARQTEQSIRLGYWMDWDDPNELRKLANAIGSPDPVTFRTASGKEVSGPAHLIAARLGNLEWGGSYFTFSTENNETIWLFLKKCHQRGKIYHGYDVMPWSGRGGSAYSQMEIAEGRKLTTHRSVFVRFPLKGRENEYLLVWTTTPWTLTSNVAAAVNPDLEYVRIRAKRDGAVYYLAKDNLEYQRLAREFKEGFGRPDWSWPRDVPRLKTIAQIFKEQGGFEVLGTVRGRDMIGWEYEGPFDDLPAQQQPGGVPPVQKLADRTGASCHRVIDGGRDSKGNPNVVAGEGTGIVHIAPGCGDIDYRLGEEHGLVAIAPLAEDGTFLDGFGPFTGRNATDPETAELVFQRLKEKGLLVAVETYPHVYPHCWRTGDELVFRLVDEWFIKMDWRNEIIEVTKQIRWLPESIQGQQREIEWLRNMGDWMISKKRFWGLALPIWVDPETGDFEVIESLDELRERAVEGWEHLEGQTPHRPWIDHVKIRNPRTGNLMVRIPDVGNPWLDAGIVPFSTLGYRKNRDYWRKWYPADFVTECFPGQFRNWFYSLLAMATMIDGTPPFRTLLGHRLVLDENGNAMHKSDGTAIWFEEAAEQLGVDTMRWMYLQQNPAVDLRFGSRLKDQRVTLQTPDGPMDQTPEGLPCCKVVSRPADEVRRQVLIPLWNSYAFFTNYARLDEFDPAEPSIPVSERPEIDRWILSNLQALIDTAHKAFRDYDVMTFCQAAVRFIDDLSSWYIRRNRRRFWRSRQAGDRDKTAAYQTLYEVLVTLTKLLAPCIPFLTERIYQNLVRSWDAEAPESVHLCDYPVADASLLDEALNRRMALAQRVVRLGHRLREEASLRVRQPLAEIRVACADEQDRAAVRQLADLIEEELNVKKLTVVDSLDELVRHVYKPNLKTLGPKFGKRLPAVRAAIEQADRATLEPLRRGETVTLTVEGEPAPLTPDDVLVSTEHVADWLSAEDDGVQVALCTALTPELKREGMARDFVRHVQQARKDANLEIQDRIRIRYAAADESDENVRHALAAIDEWSDYIRTETLADELQRVPADELSRDERVRRIRAGNAELLVSVERVG